MQLNSGSSSQFLMIEVYVTAGAGGGVLFDMCCRCVEAKNLTVQASY